jgi:hypothetical protein
MRRSPLATILLLVIGLLAAGLLALGAFPPEVTPEHVERILPNERFSSGR